MKKIAGKRKSDDTKIDLTPMLDVVFILLIFFVVTATFLSETSISAASSDNNNDQPPPEDDDKKNILFEIGPNNEIILNGNPRPIIQTRFARTLTSSKPKTLLPLSSFSLIMIPTSLLWLWLWTRHDKRAWLASR